MGLFSKRRNRDENMDHGKGKVIAFLNQKGGVGKTTLALNTASALQARGHKVLCLDMDPQANLTHLFGVNDPQYSLFHLLINQVKELKTLHAPVTMAGVLKSKNGLDLLPAGQELSGLELTVAGITAPRQLILKKLIENERLLHRYDYVIIDGPPTLGLLVVNILCACHGVMVPFRPDGLSRKGLGHFYDILDQIEDMGVTQIPEVLAHIPNLMDTRRRQENDDLARIKDDVREYWGEERVVEPFYNRVGLVKATAEKKTVFDYKSAEYLSLQKQFGELASLIDGHLGESNVH
jgi:chromosome partitioning protein